MSSARMTTVTLRLDVEYEVEDVPEWQVREVKDKLYKSTLRSVERIGWRRKDMPNMKSTMVRVKRDYE